MEVDTRSNRNAVLSGGGGSPQAFNLNSWKGLTEVLKAAREAGMDPEDYGDFRDKVLSYAQSGGDGELKREIDAVVREHGLTPVTEAGKTEARAAAGAEELKKAEAAPAQEAASRTDAADPPPEEPAAEAAGNSGEPRPQGYSRPTPTFVPPTERSTEKEDANDAARQPEKDRAERPAAEPQTAEPQQEQEPSGASPDAENEPVPDDAVTPAESAPAAPAASPQGPATDEMPADSVSETPDAPADAAPERAEDVPEHTLQPTHADQRSAPPASKETPSAAPLPQKDHDEYKTRITEIKRDVNARVGNPVTLIDAGNEVGREYMNALLAAMKATAGGQSGNLDRAMAALEGAYRKIIDIAPGPGEAPATNAEATETPSEPPAVSPAPAPESAGDETPPAETVPETAPESTVETAEVAADETESARAVVPDVSPEQNAAPKTATGTKHTPIPSLADEADAGEDADEKRGGYAAPAAAQPEPAAPVESSNAGGEPDAVQDAAQKPSSTPSQLNHFEQKDLNREEVTTGLEQLLHEWNLFKSSGFFGTGPGGMEHPLFKHLAPLSMSSIVSGRFENASPEIIQSIKDYTNAWRHEQGVSYTPSESFEHYLRRVVDRILKRQKS